MSDTDKSDKMREAERLIVLLEGAAYASGADSAISTAACSAYRAALLAHIRTMEATGLSAEVQESWWLIEAVAPPRPLYFAGLRRATEAKRPHQAITTEDAGKAVRYPTEDTAKLAIAQMIGADTSNHLWPLLVANSAWKVAEHIFDYTARQAAASLAAGVQEDKRPCTCHPDDNPPTPCPRKFALDECRAATRPEVAAPLPTPDMQEVAHALETAARFAIEGIQPTDAEVLHWREIIARCRAAPPAPAVRMLAREEVHAVLSETWKYDPGEFRGMTQLCLTWGKFNEVMEAVQRKVMEVNGRAELRMLTEAEIWALWEAQRYPGTVRWAGAIQRKFCAVNGLTIQKEATP